MMSTATYDARPRTMVTALPRRLGSVLARPRDLYMLYLPLCMLATGVTCWVVTTDVMLMLGSVVLALISLYIFYGIVIDQKPLRVSTLLVTTLGLGYGLGTANTWFTLPRSGQELGLFMHKDPVALTHTMGSILFSLSIVLSLGEMFERPVFGEDFELEFRPQSIVFITAGVLVLGAAFATGKLSYMGAQASETGDLSIVSAFGGWLAGTLLAISLVAALNFKGRAARRYLLFLTLVEFVLEIPLGRRNMIYAVVLTILCLRLGRFRFNWSWPKRLVIGIILAGMLYVTSIAFFYLRLAGYSSGKTHIGLGERITLAIGFYKSKSFSEVQKSFSKNVQSRTFIIGFLAELEDYSNHFTPGYGLDFKGQFEKAIPSVLYPSKDKFFGEEGLANELFGSAYLDEGNSLLTAGVIDFGLLGMVAYPLLMTIMMRAFFEFLGQKLPTFVAVFMIMASVGDILQAENGLSTYFVAVRNGLLFGLFVWFFMALPAFTLRKEIS